MCFFKVVVTELARCLVQIQGLCCDVKNCWCSRCSNWPDCRGNGRRLYAGMHDVQVSKGNLVSSCEADELHGVGISKVGSVT